MNNTLIMEITFLQQENFKQTYISKWKELNGIKTDLIWWQCQLASITPHTFLLNEDTYIDWVIVIDRIKNNIKTLKLELDELKTLII